jgi:hypothetical protein
MASLEPLLIVPLILIDGLLAISELAAVVSSRSMRLLTLADRGVQSSARHQGRSSKAMGMQAVETASSERLAEPCADRFSDHLLPWPSLAPTSGVWPARDKAIQIVGSSCDWRLRKRYRVSFHNKT